ncbi:hypothetical protein H4R35_004309 [Dimargaris xerosporica]|nr:hypothetical protein H4R35_004309 [Dimargaris xerosporica]
MQGQLEGFAPAAPSSAPEVESRWDMAATLPFEGILPIPINWLSRQRNRDPTNHLIVRPEGDPTPVFHHHPSPQQEPRQLISKESEEAKVISLSYSITTTIDDDHETDMLPEEYVGDVISEHASGAPLGLLEDQIDMLSEEYGSDAEPRLPETYYNTCRRRPIKTDAASSTPALSRIGHAGQFKRTLKHLVADVVDEFYQKLSSYDYNAANSLAPLATAPQSSLQAMSLWDAASAADRGHFVFFLYWDADAAKIRSKYPDSDETCAKIDKRMLGQISAIPEHFLTAFVIRLSSQHHRIKKEIDRALEAINRQLPDLSKITLPAKTKLSGTNVDG